MCVVAVSHALPARRDSRAVGCVETCVSVPGSRVFTPRQASMLLPEFHVVSPVLYPSAAGQARLGTALLVLCHVLVVVAHGSAVMGCHPVSPLLAVSQSVRGMTCVGPTQRCCLVPHAPGSTSLHNGNWVQRSTDFQARLWHCQRHPWFFMPRTIPPTPASSASLSGVLRPQIHFCVP